MYRENTPDLQDEEFQRKSKQIISQLDYFVTLYKDYFLEASRMGYSRCGIRGALGIMFKSMDDALSITEARKRRTSKKVTRYFNQCVLYVGQDKMESGEMFKEVPNALDFTKGYKLNDGFCVVFMVRLFPEYFTYFPTVYNMDESKAGELDPYIINRSQDQIEKRRQEFIDSIPEIDKEFYRSLDISKYDPNSEKGKEYRELVIDRMTRPTKCSNCLKESTKVLAKCSKCMATGYCDRNCQRQNWNIHKEICNQLKNMLIMLQMHDNMYCNYKT